MSLAYILGKPTHVKFAGNVFPVKVKHWDEFEECLSVLMLSKKRLELKEETVDISLLDRIIFGLNSEEVVSILCKAFNLVFRSEEFKFKVEDSEYFFINENKQTVNSENYDDLRKTILHQNIIIEPKVYKDKHMQEWAEKVLEARSKNAANITLEGMITTVATFSGKHYWDIAEYTIYQLKSEFNRIIKFKDFEASTMVFMNPYVDAKNIKIEHFAEYLDLYADPYKDVFKSKDKMNISKALK